MKQNLFGSAAPKSRPFDVGANLLGEWIAEQAKLRREIYRSCAIAGGSLAVAAVTIPILWQDGTAAAVQAGKLKLGVKQLDTQLVASDKARKDAQPSIVVGDMCKRTRASFDFLIGQTDRVLRAGNPHMVLSGLRTEVTAAEAHTTIQAFAEDDGAIDAFARKVSEAGAKVDAVTNSRPSPLLAPAGLSFQYEKRMVVPQ